MHHIVNKRDKGLSRLRLLAVICLPFAVSALAGAQWEGTTVPSYCLTCSVGIGTPVPTSPLHVLRSNQSQLRIESTSSTATDTALDLADPNRRWVWGINVFGIGAGKFSLFDGTAFATRLVVDTLGRVGIGTTSPATALHVVGDATVTGNIAAKYQDLAEWVPARGRLLPGTVVALDPGQSNQVVSSSRAYDTRVAGVISERPGLLLGEAGDGKVMVATTGRVKVKVDADRGAIRVGDLLVTAGIEGMAMRSQPVNVAGISMHRPGTLIGKALEPLEKGQGEILVLLSLQ